MARRSSSSEFSKRHHTWTTRVRTIARDIEPANWSRPEYAVPMAPAAGDQHQGAEVSGVVAAYPGVEQQREALRGARSRRRRPVVRACPGRSRSRRAPRASRRPPGSRSRPTRGHGSPAGRCPRRPAKAPAGRLRRAGAGRSRLAADAALVGTQDRLRPAGDLQLGEDGGHVVADRLRREEQLGGDLRRTPSAAPAAPGRRARARSAPGTGTPRRSRPVGRRSSPAPARPRPGPKIASPATTPRTARTISSCSASLSR